MITTRAVKRFWSKVAVRGPEECWLWTASRARGYGRFQSAGRQQAAHRISLIMVTGPAPVSKPIALHTCRNRHCVNPQHLTWGTHKQNLGPDRARDGTLPTGERHGSKTQPHRVARGSRVNTAKLTETDVRNIRATPNIPAPEWALKLKVHRSLIYQIRRGVIWKHI